MVGRSSRFPDMEARRRIENELGVTLRSEPIYREWLHTRCFNNRVSDIADLAALDHYAGIYEDKCEAYDFYVHGPSFLFKSRPPLPRFCEQYLENGYCNKYCEYSADEARRAGVPWRPPSCFRLHADQRVVSEIRRVRKVRGPAASDGRRYWCADFLAGLCVAGHCCPEPHLDADDVHHMAQTLFFTDLAGVDHSMLGDTRLLKRSGL